MSTQLLVRVDQAARLTLAELGSASARLRVFGAMVHGFMMVMRTLIAVPCAVSLMLALAPAFSSEPAACPADTLTSAASGLPDHDPALARRLVASGGLLLDVRTGEEYANRHIEGAVNIPIGELKGRLAEIERLTGSDKRTPIVVYCASGRRAQQAKDVLLEAGYEQVTNLGGIDDWNRR